MIDFDVFVDGEEYKVYETLINRWKQQVIEEAVATGEKESLIDE